MQIYRERHRTENLFAKLKSFHLGATLCDKSPLSCAAFLSCARSLIKTLIGQAGPADLPGIFAYGSYWREHKAGRLGHPFSGARSPSPTKAPEKPSSTGSRAGAAAVRSSSAMRSISSAPSVSQGSSTTPPRSVRSSPRSSTKGRRQRHPGRPSSTPGPQLAHAFQAGRQPVYPLARAKNQRPSPHHHRPPKPLRRRPRTTRYPRRHRQTLSFVNRRWLWCWPTPPKIAKNLFSC